MKKEITFEELRNKVEPISIEFHIDYSEDNMETNLGALSPFIIDVDIDTSTALILAEYKIKADEKRIWNVLESSYYKDGFLRTDYDSHEAIKDSFQKLFELVIYAVNPTKPEEKQRKKTKELVDLFPFRMIYAERRLGEDGTQDNSLSSLISDFFSCAEDEFDPNVFEQIQNLRSVVEDANKDVQKRSDEILSKLVSDTVGFGYPNSEELQLGVITDLSIDDQIKNKTQLSYMAGAEEECLPSTYNGLGYKNLIKIEFILASFAQLLKQSGPSCIPLLFIEEPESHMHPQMQQAFAAYLESFLQKIDGTGIQTFLTSHSPHIVNTIDFSQIRYAKKTSRGVIFRNLNAFVQQNESNASFVRKYLTLTKCDLFFADKAILVEGASERLLLPDMIEKCYAAGDFESQEYTLKDQYYTLVEVGGAHAFRFIPFIEFLGIPCLILTDIDPVANFPGDSGKSVNKSVPVSQGETTSNATLKWWIKQSDSGKKKVKISLSDVISMTHFDKTIGNCHIEFQTEEHGLCGHSLEEAIQNVNREHYKLGDNITEEMLEFEGKSKTDFALDLILECPNYVVPTYIKQGLIWLNNQKCVFE